MRCFPQEYPVAWDVSDTSIRPTACAGAAFSDGREQEADEGFVLRQGKFEVAGVAFDQLGADAEGFDGGGFVGEAVAVGGAEGA